MAEPVSSIVTLATVSLAIIRETAKFIKESKEIDTSLRRLHKTLRDFEATISLVQSTCRRTPASQEGNSQFVENKLSRCRKYLERLRSLVEDLLEQQSQTFLQKVGVKWKSDRSKAEIQEAIHDIKELMEQIKMGIGCWTVEIGAETQRRLSETRPTQQSNHVPALQQIDESEPISPLSRTWSESPTAYDHDSDIPRRSTSSATQTSRASVSSASSRPSGISERHDSIASPMEPEKKNNDSVEFHFQISKCARTDTQVQAIRAALSEDASLVDSEGEARRRPLHLAAQRGDVTLAQILLQFSANINAKDSHSWSVLDHAVHSNEEDFVEFLLDNNVDETAILEQNMTRFEEIQQTLDLRRSMARKASKKVQKAPKPQMRFRTRSGSAT